MATTYTLIDKAELTSNQSSVSFTGLGAYSSDYTDLLLRICGRSDRSNPDYRMWMKFNGSTSNYSAILLYNAGGSVGSASYAADSFGCPAAYGIPNSGVSTSNTFSNIDIYIPNAYSSNYKSWSTDSTSENNGSGIGQGLFAGLWSDTASLTSIEVNNNAGLNWVSGSSFYLYGIKKN